MGKIRIPLDTDDAIANLLRVKPTADMPRMSDFKVKSKTKGAKKKAAKKK